jgi:hypothetical protein
LRIVLPSQLEPEQAIYCQIKASVSLRHLSQGVTEMLAETELESGVVSLSVAVTVMV